MDLAQKIADAVIEAYAELDGPDNGAALLKAIRTALPVAHGEAVDIEKLEALGWQIAVCSMCGTHASAIKPASRIAELEREVERLLEAISAMQNHLAANMDEASIHYAAVEVIGMGNEALAAQEKNDE